MKSFEINLQLSSLSVDMLFTKEEKNFKIDFITLFMLLMLQGKGWLFCLASDISFR